MTSTDPGSQGSPTLRPTRQRRAVVDALESFDDFRSAQEIHDLLGRRGETVGLATVYRTLQRLAEAGEVDLLRTEDGEAIYRRCSESHRVEPEHGHVHGEDCGHLAVEHGDHVDYVHDGHRHAPHGKHYDEH